MTQKLLSTAYRDNLFAMHALRPDWGNEGHEQATEIARFMGELGAFTVLDYGCGKGTLKAIFPPGLDVIEYDPGIRGKDAPPPPAHLVVAIDVLEHIEPECLDEVLNHIYGLAEKGIYFVVSTRRAGAILPDGRNAHLIVADAGWWINKFKDMGWLDKPAMWGVNLKRSEFQFWLTKL